MEMRPIKTEDDYSTALAEIEKLFEAQPNTPEGDRLEVLTTLVEVYEQEHYPIDAPDPIKAILYYIESRGLSLQDLQFYLGNQTNVTDLLQRKTSLTLEMIRALHTKLGISADVLIKPYLLN